MSCPTRSRSARSNTLRQAARVVVAVTLFWGFATPALAATPRILLVGDSWVAQAWQARAFQTAMINRGFGQWEEKGDVTAIGGTTAADWATPANLALITAELTNNPTIDIVHLSVGGNDFLGAPPGTPIATLLSQIAADTQTIVDHILTIRPDARIALSIYDYVPAGFNTELAIFTQLAINLATSTEGFFVIDNLGVLHHAFGYPGEFGPGETPLPGGFPDYIPLEGGDPAFPGSNDAFDDSIHPNDASYVRLAEHAIDEFYGPWLATTVPGLGAPAVIALAALMAGIGARRVRRA